MQAFRFLRRFFFPNLVFFSLPIFLSLPNHQQYMPAFAIGVTITMLMFSLIIVPLYQLDQRRSGSELLTLQSSLINTLHIPLVIAILTGLACVVIGWRPPALIMHTMDKFGPVLASTGLIILGMNIDSGFFTRFRISVWSAIIAKSILMPLAGVALIPFFPLSSPQVFALVMMIACPTVGIAAMAAKKHSVVSDQIIDIMIGSTLISLMLFPFWLWLARHLS